MQDLTAAQLVRALQELIEGNAAVGDLPVVAIEEGHLGNIVGVNTSRLDGGMMMLQARDYDRPGKSGTLSSSPTSDDGGDGGGAQQPVVLHPAH
ncbi:hypothetical protein ACFV42_23440 [Streptomyces solisilvae]|uniref:hypothetical protein n=1 Tax=Streptomyces malaysiensis TaxID=92644 RepID=UPI0036AFF703